MSSRLRAAASGFIFSPATERAGGFGAPQKIELAGRITALTAGEIDASDNRADLLIGLEDERSAASMLVFENLEGGIFASPVKYRLETAAISLETGKLDDDSMADAAILTGSGVFILHGRGRHFDDYEFDFRQQHSRQWSGRRNRP